MARAAQLQAPTCVTLGTAMSHCIHGAFENGRLALHHSPVATFTRGLWMGSGWGLEWFPGIGDAAGGREKVGTVPFAPRHRVLTLPVSTLHVLKL